jgi:fatty acid desaturase
MMSAPGHTIARRRWTEWPTVWLAAFIYLSWGLLTFNHDSIPLWALIPLGAWFTAWQASLQHEIIHGHPTRSRKINRLIGCWPLLLWLPFESYRISHLVHHRDERLTDPLDDPESHYWTPEQWAEVGFVRRRIIRANATLLGRVTIGPAWSMGRFLGREAVGLVRGDKVRRRIWLDHALFAVPVLGWLVLVCDMNLWIYFIAFVYPGTALMLVRSFAEHRAESEVDERTAIVENAPVMGLLFLYNNLHAVHHERPTMAWYEIPAWYRTNRDRLVAENGGLVYNSYLDVARRYLISAHDEPVHPHGRAPLPIPEAAE